MIAAEPTSPSTRPRLPRRPARSPRSYAYRSRSSTFSTRIPLRPEIEQALRRDLENWASAISGAGEISFSVRSGWGRVASHLGQLATEVSRGVLHDRAIETAAVTVAYVAPSAEEEAVALPTSRRILVPTDFSPLANRAIRYAYGLVGRGGEVHVVTEVVLVPAEEVNV